MNCKLRVKHFRNVEQLNKEANVFVKNVAEENEDELRELMTRFGQIFSCKVTSRNYGYVQFENEEDAQKAI